MACLRSCLCLPNTCLQAVFTRLGTVNFHLRDALCITPACTCEKTKECLPKDDIIRKIFAVNNCLLQCSYDGLGEKWAICFKGRVLAINSEAGPFTELCLHRLVQQRHKEATSRSCWVKLGARLSCSSDKEAYAFSSLRRQNVPTSACRLLFAHPCAWID